MQKISKNSNTIFINSETAKTLGINNVNNIYIGNKKVLVEQVTPTSKSFCVPLMVAKAEVFLTDYRNGEIKSDYNYRSNFVQNIVRTENVNRWNTNINVIFNELLDKKGFDSNIRFECAIQDHIPLNVKKTTANKITKNKNQKMTSIINKIKSIQTELDNLIESYKATNDIDINNEQEIMDVLYRKKDTRFKMLDKIHSLQFSKEKLLKELVDIKLSLGTDLGLELENISQTVFEIFENIQQSSIDKKSVGSIKNRIKQIIFDIQRIRKEAKETNFNLDIDKVYSILNTCKEVLNFKG